MILTQRSLYSIYYLISVFIMALFICFCRFRINCNSLCFVIFRRYRCLYIISVYILGSNLIDDFEKLQIFDLIGLLVYFVCSYL